MSGAIARVSPSTSLVGAQPAPDAKTAKLRSAAGDFESLLIKQLLKESKVAGPEKDNGYGDMAIDALAGAIERGGGLGLAKHIEHAINGRAGTASASTTAAHALTAATPTAAPFTAAVPGAGAVPGSPAATAKKGR